MAAPSSPIYPEHIKPATMVSIRKGLDYLVKTQSSNGGWYGGEGGRAYPVTLTSLAGMALLANGNTPSRGRYADAVKKTVNYLLRQARPNGLITGSSEESGRPMYGHGFALTFLACVHGMESNRRNRDKIEKIIVKAVAFTGAAQSREGGWTYTPGAGDEGSVTVTQMQALRAAENAGFHVPKGVIKKTIRYLEMCQASDGGIRYSLRSGNRSQLAVSTAAVACLYNAGEYDSIMAESCLEYVYAQFKGSRSAWAGGHGFYTHLYGAQSFYIASDQHWDEYFPKARDHFVKQQQADGAWVGDGIGKTYGTSIALIILQLPFKFLPIYQR